MNYKDSERFRSERNYCLAYLEKKDFEIFLIYIKVNHLSFMNWPLSRVIVRRTRVENNFLKIKLIKIKHSIQNNVTTVPLVRKSKKFTIVILMKIVSDKKYFSEDHYTVLPLQNWTKRDAQILNNYFSNIVSNREIAEYTTRYPISDTIKRFGY